MMVFDASADPAALAVLLDSGKTPSEVSGGPVDHVPTAELLRAVLEVALSRVQGPLVVAISGGRDSMALMHALARWAPERLAAVATYDHGTGGYATEAAGLVATEARRLGLTVVRERARTPVHGEAEWRDARWKFLHRVAKAYRARVATAHTRDDQVETIVMRLLRGTGARGMAALAAPSPVVRPWLPVARAEVAAWADAEGVPYIDDPMNVSRRYQRGRVRHELLPALESAQPGFTADMLALGEQAAAWRRDVDTFLDAMGPVFTSHGTLRISATAFDNTTDEGRAAMWPALFARIGVALDARGTRELVRFSKSRRHGAHVSVSGGAKAVRITDGYGEFFEVRKATGATTADDFSWTGSADQVPRRLGRWRIRRLTPADAKEGAENLWIFGAPIDATLTIRGWQSGDRIQSTGVPAGRRVTRYFSEAHIPALDRAGWPVVQIGDTLLSVPGICRSKAAPHRPGWPDSIWYRCEREHD